MGYQDSFAYEGYGHVMPVYSPEDTDMVDAYQVESVLRKGVAWLNNEGGFEGKIKYDKILAASAGLHPATIEKAMKNLEDKEPDDIKDPTAFLSSALRKEGGGRRGSAHQEAMA